ncbi:MAG TPA: DUF4126 domain-containing protein [Candidatus Elarobacter sp.]|jgi:hypothetical protein|nr:DUF4126 domain-containing protein [Candidatus Elarobacter sp.]
MDPHGLALAYSLSTIAGLRASLTVVAVSIAIHVHAFAPPPELAWVGSNVTLAIAAAFAVADFFGDKIPIVDHLVHVVHVALAPVAGAIAAAGVDTSGATNVSALGIFGVLGGANALGVHGLRAATRGGSSAISAGALNPVLSLADDVVAVAGLALAFIAPIAVACVAAIATIAFVLVARVAWNRRPRAAAR